MDDAEGVAVAAVLGDSRTGAVVRRRRRWPRAAPRCEVQDLCHTPAVKPVGRLLLDSIPAIAYISAETADTGERSVVRRGPKETLTRMGMSMRGRSRGVLPV